MINPIRSFLFEAWFLRVLYNPKETNKKIKPNRNTFLLVSDIDFGELMIFQGRVNFFYQFLFNFPQVHENIFNILKISFYSYSVYTGKGVGYAFFKWFKMIFLSITYLISVFFLTHWFGDTTRRLMGKKSKSRTCLFMYLSSIVRFCKTTPARYAL